MTRMQDQWMTSIDDKALLETLCDVADAAILPHFRSLKGIDNKAAAGGFDPVTAADRAAEEAIRAVLQTERPGDGILGEEFEPIATTNGRTWILDPIDGTRAFMMGLPTWGVLIALADETGPVIGAMSQPFVGERFYAAPNGVFGKVGDRPPIPLSTRRCAGIAEAIVTTTSPDMFTGNHGPVLERIRAAVRMVRFGADCYGFAMVAAGHCDAVLERGLKPFDIAPFIPMVRAAGGIVTDFSGNPLGPRLTESYNGEGLAVGDPSMLEPMLTLIHG